MYLDNYKIFKTFRSREHAQEMIDFLSTHNIPSEVVENKHELIDTFYTGNQYQEPYQLLIPHSLFIKAEEHLKAEAEKNLSHLPKNYYLFSYCNQELMDILIKPDKWGELDVGRAGSKATK